MEFSNLGLKLKAKCIVSDMREEPHRGDIFVEYKYKQKYTRNAEGISKTIFNSSKKSYHNS